MTQTAPAERSAPVPEPGVTQVEIVVPVLDEAVALGPCVERLRAYLHEALPFSASICIADNGSTDGTWQVALDLVRDHDDVRAVRISESGRGRALKTVWSNSDAEVLAYMDVDLSTDLGALLPLVAPLLSGHSDVAIGTRLAGGSRVVRGDRREVLSRGYNVLLRAVLGSRFTDAQCGFKAIRADVAAAVLPLVQDSAWFFDTELLVLAERAGLRIHEVPVDWVDDPDSRVAIVPTVLADLRGTARMAADAALGRVDLEPVRARYGRPRPQQLPLLVRMVRFAMVGVLSTVAYALLFLLVRGPLGPQGANLFALLVTAVGNTALNRRMTFGVTGPRHRLRHHAKGLAAFLVGWGLTAGTLAVLHAGSVAPSHTSEVVALTVANLVATVVRFCLFTLWIFPGRTAPAPVPAKENV